MYAKCRSNADCRSVVTATILSPEGQIVRVSRTLPSVLSPGDRPSRSTSRTRRSPPSPATYEAHRWASSRAREPNDETTRTSSSSSSSRADSKPPIGTWSTPRARARARGHGLDMAREGLERDERGPRACSRARVFARGVAVRRRVQVDEFDLTVCYAVRVDDQGSDGNGE